MLRTNRRHGDMTARKVRRPASHRTRGGGGAGLPVDFSGGPTVDPTENVKDLSEALSQRQDDLRESNNKYLDARLDGMENMAILRSSHNSEIMALRAEFYKEIRHMESDRVDKIRSVDVANAAATAAQLLSAVTTLATTAQATAETLRNQVAATAAAVASQTERVVNPIIERLALLEKSSNFGQGRAELANPALSEAVIEMRKLASGIYERRGHDAVADPALTATLASLASGQQAMAVAIGGLKTTDATASGRQQGVGDSRQMLTWFLGIVIALIGLYTFTQRPNAELTELRNELRARSNPTPSQIIYTPAPPGTQLPTAPPAQVPR